MGDRMSFQIAVAGKGGTGKTTLAALTVRCLLDAGAGPVLAVDADPNANLGEALGVRVEGTLAEILAQTKEPRAVPPGMSREAFVEFRLSQALSEARGVDLLTMGGPEGPGCYCYPNDLLRKHMETLSRNYRYLVLDNEAGLEHLSRRIARDVDVLFVTSDPTMRGLTAAQRIWRLAGSLEGTRVKSRLLVLNRASSEDGEELCGAAARLGLEVGAVVPNDPQVAALDLEGRPLSSLAAGSPALEAVRDLVKRVAL
ncbi:MAG: AAA family ATPase [Acetobacteraceae bacterium]|nr:AAA family ATPase [Acetobacteraceae bacterium]